LTGLTGSIGFIVFLFSGGKKENNKSAFGGKYLNLKVSFFIFKLKMIIFASHPERQKYLVNPWPRPDIVNMVPISELYAPGRAC